MDFGSNNSFTCVNHILMTLTHHQKSFQQSLISIEKTEQLGRGGVFLGIKDVLATMEEPTLDTYLCQDKTTPHHFTSAHSIDHLTPISNQFYRTQ